MIIGWLMLTAFCFLALIAVGVTILVSRRPNPSHFTRRA